MRKLLFIINPISGGIDKQGLRASISQTCENENLQYSFHETTGENDKQFIKEKIDQFLPTDTIACGGDGTVNLVAEQILSSQINLGIIPLGSANGLAEELDIPEDIDEALNIIIEGKARGIDALYVNNKYLCLHLSDVGLNAKLVRRFERNSGRGKLGYARHFFATLFKQKPIKYTFHTEAETFEERAEMVVFANAKKYGTGAIVNPIGQIDDGKFEVCIFKPYPWYAIFRMTYLFFTGKLNYSPFVRIFSTTKIMIEGKKPEHLQVDGETVGKHKKVAVCVAKEKLQILRP